MVSSASLICRLCPLEVSAMVFEHFFSPIFFLLSFQDSKDMILDLLVLVLHVPKTLVHFVPSILSLCSLYIFLRENIIQKSKGKIFQILPDE